MIVRTTRKGFIINRFSRFSYREIHHLYYGYVFILMGCVVGEYVGVFLIGVGLWIAIDDVYQHYVQVENPRYISPLGRMFLPIYKTEWWRKLVRRVSFLRDSK